MKQIHIMYYDIITTFINSKKNIKQKLGKYNNVTFRLDNHKFIILLIS